MKKEIDEYIKGKVEPEEKDEKEDDEKEKGEDKEVEMKYPSFIKEHKELIRLLRKVGENYDNKELLKMASEQEAECQKVMKEYNK